MKRISVAASRGYDVLIDPGCLSRAGAQLAAVLPPCAAAVVADDTVSGIYGETVCRSLSAAGFRPVRFTFPHGEASKTLAVYGKLLRFLADEHLTRTDVLVALGGGVAGDLGGFAAATYLRGIPFAQLPTTLLAAVDSSVGGKTGVDLPEGKNLAGAFWQPALVLCDPETLSTLPEETLRDGCAEVIKYGLLGSEPLFRALQRTPVLRQAEEVIAACVGMKRDLVEEDEFDRGSRRLLNLGHTFGHAVEACSRYTISHGRAVAVGMAMIARAAAAKGFCAPEVPAAAEALLTQYGLPTECPCPAEAMLRALRADKKIADGAMHLVVPEAVGRCRVETVPFDALPGWLAAGGAK